jgi:AraC family transcriptional regulator of adaptative response / DNA-3-methyladenine glycosylase II
MPNRTMPSGTASARARTRGVRGKRRAGDHNGRADDSLGERSRLDASSRLGESNSPRKSNYLGKNDRLDESGGRSEDAGLEVFTRLAEQVRRDPRATADTAALARAAGLARTALRGLMHAHTHLSAETWLERERVRFACRLLGEGCAAPDEIAEAAGFADDLAFRRAFAAETCMTPEAYRALRNAAVFSLRLPPAYRAAEVLAYHGRDPESPCEKVAGEQLFKALATDAGPFVLEIALGRGEAVCALHHDRPLAAHAARIAHAVALRMLGLTADVVGFEARAAGQPRMRALLTRRPGLRLPLTATPFDGLCWAIIGQQINLRFASALRRELLDLAGEPVQEFRAHPAPERVAALEPADLRKRRFSGAKAEYLIGAARAVVEGRLAPDEMHAGSAAAAERTLMSVRGIGTWTARYMLLRGVGFADCAPAGDAALAAALAKLHCAQERPGPTRVETLMRRYAPHRSLATCHLWASLRD